MIRNANRSMLLAVAGLLWITPTATALDTVTETPFTYIIDYYTNQHRDKEFWKHFESTAPDLFHPPSDLRYMTGFGASGNPMEDDVDVYFKEMRAYLDYMRGKGVKWITPYLCNQTIIGNDVKRTGAWAAYDRWDELQGLGLGPKPPDPLQWMQREPSGNFHYNYKRKCMYERGQPEDVLRYAPCPNNPHWRRFCNNEARLGAEVGFNGFFIDNCIIHCYCEHCEARFQEYLKRNYSPQEFKQAFGTEEYSKIRLYKEGDIRLWARSSPKFIPWLEAKYTPEERRTHFDTTGSLKPVNVDNAGGGMLIGESHAFVRDHLLPPGTQPTFENVRLANPALQTRIGRLRWAETLMFWGDSIGDMLSEMGEAGRKVDPDFFLMPNWGTMQRVNAAVGRAEDGHDMKRWKRGGSWQMYEEANATGKIAPGVILEYDMELRFAFAGGIRAMNLPYKLTGKDVNDVAQAEMAASGGSVLVDTFGNSDIQNSYQNFFRKNAELYEGYRSKAKVALAYFFDQNYYLNVEHFRHVHALSRYLADQQIPFDIVVEEDLQSGAALNRYQVLVLPNVTHLSDPETTALTAYVKAGGTLVLVGETGTHDRLDRKRDASKLEALFGEKKDRVIRFDNLSSVLPHPGVFMEPCVQATRDAAFLDVAGQTDIARYASLAKLDQKLWIKRYQDPGPLTPVIEKALGRPAHLLEPWAASGVRNTVYWKPVGTGERMIVHLVNKNVPLAVPKEERLLQPVRNLTLRVPLPKGSKVTSVECFEPGREKRTLAWKTQGAGTAEVTVDLLRAYAVIAIECQ